jgi:hypothetical protein
MPVAGDNLSLGSLGYAVGSNGGTTSTTCLAANGRGSNATTAMSDFTITGITCISSVASLNENTSTTICAQFSGECTLFHRISCGSTQARNFVWSKIFNADSFNLTGTLARAPGYSALSVTVNTNTCVKLKFADCFNTTATNYNTDISKVITIIDVPA